MKNKLSKLFGSESKEFILNILNRTLPKRNRVLIRGHGGMASNAVVLANFIQEEYDLSVYFAVNPDLKKKAYQVLNTEIKLVTHNSLYFHFLLWTSRYFFSTHGGYTLKPRRNQTTVNVWHGASYKKLRLARDAGEQPLLTDITIATSEITKTAFAKFFGVSHDSIFIAGYPRNDVMIRAKERRDSLLASLDQSFLKYDKILIWLPTFRRIAKNQEGENLKLYNAFNISDFDVDKFNQILESQNAVCLLKPHYFYLDKIPNNNYSHIKIIDEEWLLDRKITLYHLLACTDLLITDYSSVMIDYTLIDQPVICFSTDLEEFKRTQGLYFDDFESWVPTQFIQDEDTFFDYLEMILNDSKDPYLEKRRKIKDVFFTYSDARNSERICNHVFKGDYKRKKK